MSKGHTRRTHLCKGRKAAVAASAGPAKAVSHSTSKMESMQLSGDTARGLKREGLSNLKLFVKPRSGKAGQLGSQRDEPEDSASTTSTFSTDVGSTDNSSEGTEIHPRFRKKLADIEDQRKWTLLETGGVRPVPRFNHAAAVVGRKLLVIGGETGSGTRNDVQMLHLGKLSWADVGFGDSAPSKGLPIKTGPTQELPNCKGHSLIAWGKTVILVGGQMDPPTDKVAVWSFDLEMDCWTAVVTKGEIPTARSGQSVTRAGSILIMFGGEDLKGRKLNDLNILDLKSLMWLPLHPSGKGPSARARHVADMYDDRFLFIFGGETKSKMSNDTYALDFDNMEWSKLKTKGIPAAPRAGHAGALVGNMWYIVGGDCRGPGLLGTAVLDMSRMEWLVVASASPDSVASLQGLSLVFVQRKERRYLVAFGGYGTQACSSVYVLHIPLPEQAPRNTLAGLLELPTTPDFNTSSRSSELLRSQHGSYHNLMGSAIPCACVSVAKNNLESAIERRSSSQRSTSISWTDFSAELDRDSGLIPLRTRYAMAQNSMARLSTSSSESMSRRPASQGSNWDSGSSSRRRDLALPRLENPPSPASGSEESERQHQSAQRVRGDLQSTEVTAPSVDSGFLSAEELQITAPSVRPGLVSSVGDAGKLFLETHESVSGRTRTYKGGSQISEFSGYSETVVSGAGERRISEASVTDSTSSADSYSDRSLASTRYACPNGISSQAIPGYEEEDKLHVLSNHISEAPSTDSTSSVDSYSNLSLVSTGCASPNGIPRRTIPRYEEEDELHMLSNRATPGYLEVKLTLSSNRRTGHSEDGGAAEMPKSTIPEMEIDEALVLSRIQTANSAEERRIAIAMLKQCHEGKLAAAIRTGELFAGQCAEALRDRDEAERNLNVVKRRVERMEGKLSVALKQIKHLQDRLSATEQAREESNRLVHNGRVENLKLEHDLALKTAVLGEFQKELQSTRGVLIAEGTRAFQLEVELTDLKQKLQSSTPPGLLAPCLQQPILA